ncbi:MAG: succinyl-CoA--3-ketoacid-CoA transferase [Chloroflexi bacterium]|nr:succinyl-CoA--3-ketoacid-CoA transferase [Chloroflexota bacterium]|tara:strand:- start:113 stop:844 length:732 start_codon:yes stop_codon:yes gene_type:complete
MGNQKIYKSFDEAVMDIRSHSSVMIGGFGGSGGQPTRLMLALSKRDIKGLTIIGNVAGISETTGYGWPKNSKPIDQGIFFKKGIANKIICSFPVPASQNPKSHIEKFWLENKDSVEIVPQGTLIEKIRSAGAGIPAFYTSTGVGTIIEKQKEIKFFGKKKYLLEHALSADFALIRANVADENGNLQFLGTSRAFSPAMATASKITIVEVDEIVKVGDLDPNNIHTLGVHINRIVKRRKNDMYP